jgi:hypothetical protein
MPEIAYGGESARELLARLGVDYNPESGEAEYGGHHVRVTESFALSCRIVRVYHESGQNVFFCWRGRSMGGQVNRDDILGWELKVTP